jgi:hypothetical protein
VLFDDFCTAMEYGTCFGRILGSTIPLEGKDKRSRCFRAYNMDSGMCGISTGIGDKVLGRETKS